MLGEEVLVKKKKKGKEMGTEGDGKGEGGVKGTATPMPRNTLEERGITGPRKWFALGGAAWVGGSWGGLAVRD